MTESRQSPGPVPVQLHWHLSLVESPGKGQQAGLGLS